MPVTKGHNQHGWFYQWGSRTKYYYTANDPKSRAIAERKAIKQGKSIKLKKLKI